MPARPDKPVEPSVAPRREPPIPDVSKNAIVRILSGPKANCRGKVQDVTTGGGPTLYKVGIPGQGSFWFTRDVLEVLTPGDNAPPVQQVAHAKVPALRTGAKQQEDREDYKKVQPGSADHPYIILTSEAVDSYRSDIEQDFADGDIPAEEMNLLTFALARNDGTEIFLHHKEESGWIPAIRDLARMRHQCFYGPLEEGEYSVAPPRVRRQNEEIPRNRPNTPASAGKVRLEYYDGTKWNFVFEYESDRVAWISLGPDDQNYRTVDDTGAVITDKSAPGYDSKSAAGRIRAQRMDVMCDKILGVTLCVGRQAVATVGSKMISPMHGYHHPHKYAAKIADWGRKRGFQIAATLLPD